MQGTMTLKCWNVELVLARLMMMHRDVTANIKQTPSLVFRRCCTLAEFGFDIWKTKHDAQIQCILDVLRGEHKSKSRTKNMSDLSHCKGWEKKKRIEKHDWSERKVIEMPEKGWKSLKNRGWEEVVAHFSAESGGVGRCCCCQASFSDSTFFSCSFFKGTKGGNELQSSDQQLGVPAPIPWCSTMQIQLLISFLYKQLISGPLSCNDVLTNTWCRTLELINSRSWQCIQTLISESRQRLD